MFFSSFDCTCYCFYVLILVFWAGANLDHLQATVERCFSDIVNTGRVPRLDFNPLGCPFGAESLGQIFDIRTVRDMYELELYWPLPNQTAHYRGQSTEYYGNLIGHEGTFESI
jgi:secreted Zn-dependent insulinase-like peptidase